MKRQEIPRANLRTREILWGVAGPRSEARNPAADVRAIGLVFAAEGLAQGGLLIGQDEYVHYESGNEAVLEDAHVAEKKALAENHGHNRDVHRIPDEAVKAFDDQVLRGEDGRRGADALEGKAGEGFEQHGESDDHQQDADYAKRSETEERWLNLPAGNPIGEKHYEESGRQEEKDGGAQNSERAPGAGGWRLGLVWRRHFRAQPLGACGSLKVYCFQEVLQRSGRLRR